MTRRWSLPVAVVLVTTIVVLADAGWNRSAIRRQIVLSEREAPVAPAGREETALWLRLDFVETVDSSWGGWPGPARLAAMGLDTSRAAVRRVRDEERAAYAVLELDGPAWRAHVARQVAARTRELSGDSAQAGHVDSLVGLFRDGLERGSHLVMMDVGVDAGDLARRYPDAARHLILPAVLRTYKDFRFHDPRAAAPVDTVLGARVTLESRRLLVSGSPAASLRARAAQGYRVTIATGRRNAPWVLRVE